MYEAWRLFSDFRTGSVLFKRYSVNVKNIIIKDYENTVSAHATITTIKITNNKLGSATGSKTQDNNARSFH